MVRAYPGWNVLNNWGSQYYDETQRGFGIGEDTNSRLARRSGLQIKLASDIVDGSIGFIKKVAIKLVNEYFKMPNRNTEADYVRLSLKEFYQNTDIGDLISYGSIGVIEGLHTFDPNKGSISNFIAFRAAGKMYREASRNRTLMSIPTHIYDRALKIIKTSSSKKQSLDRLQFEDAKTFVKMSASRAELLYNLIKGDYIDIDHSLGSKDDSPSTDKWADRYLVDGKISSAEEIINEKELADSTNIILSSLTPREDKMIRLRFGIGEKTDKTLEEAAQDFEITRERARQIEAKALRKLRHPSRSKLLRNLAE